MIENLTQPLEVAARMLRAETLRSVSRSPFTRRGWSILDRWALNTPAALCALEADGLDALRGRLLAQQELETTALLANVDSLDGGLAEHEVLAMEEVQPELG